MNFSKDELVILIQGLYLMQNEKVSYKIWEKDIEDLIKKIKLGLN